MSRIGKKPIEVPQGVTVNLKNGEVLISGPLGNLNLKIHPRMKIMLEQNQIVVKRQDDNRLSRSLHGLTRTLIANAVEGVTKGFSKTLELVGVGYKASLEGEELVLSIGFSHPVRIKQPPGIKFTVEEGNIITIFGVDKEKVGQLAAKIRAIKPPDPYKGKGIRYKGEEIKLKPGKAGKGGAAGAVSAPKGGGK